MAKKALIRDWRSVMYMHLATCCRVTLERISCIFLLPLSSFLGFLVSSTATAFVDKISVTATENGSGQHFAGLRSL
jgi:hypothetical protein